MVIDVKPTRSELLTLKRKIAIAQSGHRLLKRKRDGLILEFFEVLKTAKDQRKEMADKYALASRRMAGTIALDGIVTIKTLAQSLKEKPAVDLEVKNIMGVTVPRIRAGAVKKSLLERGYGVLSASLRIEQMVDAYEDLLQTIVTAAETETTLRKLLSEIERTKRRVNALEFVVLPRLTQQTAFIRMRLEEMERENTFRLKRIKKKAAA